MAYEKNIEIYKIKGDLNTPLASNPSTPASCGVGDIIIIFDDEVWVRNWNDECPNQFAKAVYNPDFVRMNLNIFDKQ